VALKVCFSLWLGIRYFVLQETFFSASTAEGPQYIVGFAGCRIWLFSRQYLGFELKTGMGSGNFNYERVQDFRFFFMGWDEGFARGTERDTGFQFLRGLTN